MVGTTGATVSSTTVASDEAPARYDASSIRTDLADTARIPPRSPLHEPLDLAYSIVKATITAPLVGAAGSTWTLARASGRRLSSKSSVPSAVGFGRLRPSSPGWPPRGRRRTRRRPSGRRPPAGPGSGGAVPRASEREGRPAEAPAPWSASRAGRAGARRIGGLGGRTARCSPGSVPPGSVPAASVGGVVGRTIGPPGVLPAVDAVPCGSDDTAAELVAGTITGAVVVVAAPAASRRHR